MKIKALFKVKVMQPALAGKKNVSIYAVCSTSVAEAIAEVQTSIGGSDNDGCTYTAGQVSGVVHIASYKMDQTPDERKRSGLARKQASGG